MQQPRKSHFRHRSKFNQLILLNQQSLIVSSCDSIFNTVPFKDKPTIEWFPFMESIYPEIWKMVSKQSNLSFNKMETPIPELPGTYDFSFSKMRIEGEDLILWCIYDYTDLYEDFKQFQQRKNELEIHRETLEHRHQVFKNKEDIKIQQNIIIESLDHLQLTYFNKIKSALLAPINALDGITHLLSGALKNTNQNYIQQLRITLKQLTFILNELEDDRLGSLPDFSMQTFNLSDLCQETTAFVQQKQEHIQLSFSIDKSIPKTITGNFLYLKQTLQGILGNAADLHPNSTFKVKVSKSKNPKNKLQFEVIEFLNDRTIILSEQDYSALIYRLSIVKQLLDLQKGNIYVDKNPKDLSITIRFDVDFSY